MKERKKDEGGPSPHAVFELLLSFRLLVVKLFSFVLPVAGADRS